MLPKINPTTTQAWMLLRKHHEEIQRQHMRDIFAQDGGRFDRFSLRFEDILFDYSKNIITPQTMKLLLQLAEECELKSAIGMMFSGVKINETENRAVLHTALRQQSDDPVLVDGKDVIPAVRRVQKQMKKFCEDIHGGKHLGFSGKKITTVVNIGIGGSDLGPVMVTEALKPYWIEGRNVHFVSNVDGTHIAETLKQVKADETLFLIASKTFTTQETMTNAATARQWFLDNGGTEKDIAIHFAALSTNEKAVTEFGIDAKNMFVFWDWVGGRYSLWSSIGLSIALTIGYDNFEQLLAGGAAVDNHFKSTSNDKNIPVIMALIGLWYTNFFCTQTEAILPYDQYMHRFAAYFQQGNMESNGKSYSRYGSRVSYSTGPVIWGEPGTNGQHAFYQHIHQGTMMVPCDFIAPAISHNPIGDHHPILLSNFFAQTQALMNGKTEAEAREELIESGKTAAEAKKLAPFKLFEGNKPTNSFLIKKITPYTLGNLIALYEHKIFTQGIIWNIFSFDQWGVELGKQLASRILPILNEGKSTDKLDSSTRGLIDHFKSVKA